MKDNDVKYDDRLFDENGIHRDTNTRFNKRGYDKDGYDREGYDKHYF